MIIEKIKDELQSAIQIIYGIHFRIDEIEVERPRNPDFGNYSTNIAFKVAKRVDLSPNAVAATIAKRLNGLNLFEQVLAEGAFVNFWLSKKIISETIKKIRQSKENYGRNDLFKRRKIQVEFISANPTGPLTLANGRGGFGGDVLANLIEFSGAKVFREYYINDSGNQIKTLGLSVLSLKSSDRTKDEELYKGKYLEEWAKKNLKQVKDYQEKPFDLGQIIADYILKNLIKPSVQRMQIHFDNWFSEKELVQGGAVDNIINILRKSGYLYEKDGAVWLETSKFGDEKDRVLIKADGEKTYFAADIAYHFDKIAKRKFDKVIDLWGADHHGYVNRMQAALRALGFSGRLDIIIFQMVRLIKGGKEFRMSKRKGTYVTMDDLFDLIGGKDACDVARFFFLSHSFNTHLDFDLDLARERSEKNPVFYVKYAHARICRILEKAKKLKLPKANLSLLEKNEELELALKLAELPALISSIVLSPEYPVHLLTFYLRDLAAIFHRFYDSCKVIDNSDSSLTAARLELVKSTQLVLKIVMEKLIGISAPIKM